jgi:guanylate kinase
MPQARLIFLAPPSWDELVNRLLTRGTETEDERARRLETALLELDAADEFDFIIINETVQLAAETIVDLMHT